MNLLPSEPDAPLAKELIYFCDESSFMAQEDKMAVAGLALPRENLPTVLARIAAIPAPEGGFREDEVKWNTTKTWNLEHRKAYVDCLASLVEERKVHFHIRFADFSAYNHDGPRKRIDTVSKMFYQLLLHRAVRHYGTEYKMVIRPDDGPCAEELKGFSTALLIDGQNRYRAHPECIQDVVCANSEREPMLQLLDVTMGALTAVKNDRQLRQDASAAKSALAQHAVAKLGISDIHRNYDDGRRLSIWNVIPKRRGPKG